MMDILRIKTALHTRKKITNNVLFKMLVFLFDNSCSQETPDEYEELISSVIKIFVTQDVVFTEKQWLTLKAEAQYADANCASSFMGDRWGELCRRLNQHHRDV